MTDSPQELFSLECLLQPSQGRPFKRFYFYAALYFCIPLVCLAAAFLVWRLKYPLRSPVMWRKFVATLLILFFLVHPSVTRVVLQLFR